MAVELRISTVFRQNRGPLPLGMDFWIFPDLELWDLSVHIRNIRVVTVSREVEWNNQHMNKSTGIQLYKYNTSRPPLPHFSNFHKLKYTHWPWLITMETYSRLNIKMLRPGTAWRTSVVFLLSWVKPQPATKHFLYSWDISPIYLISLVWISSHRRKSYRNMLIFQYRL